jgi:hypothetical protein
MATMPERQPKLLSVSDWVYARLMVLYPATHRREYGWLLAQAFRDMSRDGYRRQGWLGFAKVWLTVSSDLLKTASLERLSSLRGTLAMLSFKQMLNSNFTTVSQDRLAARIICAGWALFTMALIAYKLPPLATNGTELAVGLVLAAVMSLLMFAIGFFGHRLSFGTRTDPALSSEFRLLLISRKSVCKCICVGLSLLTLVLGTHLLESASFNRVQLVIAVEGLVDVTLALCVLAILIGPTGTPAEHPLEHA